MAINLSKSISTGLKTSSAGNPVVEMLLLIVVSLVFLWFIILPKNSEVAAGKEALSKIAEQEGQMSGKLDTLRALIQSLEGSDAEIDLLDQSLPLEGRVTRLHFLLESLAQSVGVTVNNISVAWSGTGPVAGNKALLDNPFKATRQLQKLQGTMVVVGELDQLKIFLQKLEKSGRLINISDLGVESSTDGQLNLKLTINSYYFAP